MSPSEPEGFFAATHSQRFVPDSRHTRAVGPRLPCENDMPRRLRCAVGGLCYHAINRGNRKSRVFHDAEDYRGFMRLVAHASERIPMRILGWCLMPNHFHFVLWPREDGDMSSWMHWLLTCHVVSYRERYGTSGRVWQGRFRSFVVQEDDHLLRVQPVTLDQRRDAIVLGSWPGPASDKLGSAGELGMGRGGVGANSWRR